MKRCPQCNRTYTDDALSFCLDDGSPLASAAAPPSEPATMQYQQPRETSPQPTMAYRPGQAPPPPPPPAAAWSPMPMPPQRRSVWPWLLGIGAVVVFIGIGLVILIFAIASISNDNNNNRTANNGNNSNRITNRNANANSNTNSSAASFTDDFSNEVWGSGVSKFGRTWYTNDEYHMNGTKNGYIVMYSPKTSSYETENATVRVTVRNVGAEDTARGFGLLVHTVMKNDQLEDYGFLIDNANSGYYRIIEHKGGQETVLVASTSSSAIRTGTSSNQLEVKINGRTLAFYINGQYVTSITDTDEFLNGKCGLYTSDTAEIAFDDLEISH